MIEHTPTTPDDLAGVARGLDRLASLDAAAAPAGLDGRIADASGPLLRAEQRHGATVIGRIGVSRLRAAAAVALLAGGIAVVSMALRSAKAPTNAMEDGRHAAADSRPTTDDTALLDEALNAVSLALDEPATLTALSAEIDAFRADPASSLDSLDATSLEDSR